MARLDYRDGFLNCGSESSGILNKHVSQFEFESRFQGVPFSKPDPWQMLAAFCISAGQISQFVALNYTEVGRVAIINSSEIFISSYLAVIVFKTEKRPPVMLLVATLLATAGIIFVFPHAKAACDGARLCRYPARVCTDHGVGEARANC